MSKDSVNIIVIDGLRAGLALAVFLSAIESIFKLNVNSWYGRTTADYGLNFCDERLKTCSKSGIDTCTQHSRIDQSLGQRFRLCISTKESRQVVYQEGVNIEILQLQLIQVLQMGWYDNFAKKIFPAFDNLLFLFFLS